MSGLAMFLWFVCFLVQYGVEMFSGNHGDVQAFIKVFRKHVYIYIYIYIYTCICSPPELPSG